MNASVTAIVPMRHDSERVRGKNYRSFAGRPLYVHVISMLTECRLVDRIVVDTDSPVILEGVASTFPDVILLERPEGLRSGHTSMNDVLINAVSRLEGTFFLQTHSTNPLLTAATVDRAVERFLAGYPSKDSLMSVTRVQRRFWDDQARPVNHDANVLLRTQDLPPMYEENSCIYLFARDSLVSRRNRVGERPLLFEIDAREAWDIDDELGFRVGELLLESAENGREKP
jgi:CMP-N-acetylneuraminic acid synthetase